MSAAVGTVLAASITATALVVSNDAAARPSSAHRIVGPFGLAGDMSRANHAGSSHANAQQAGEPDSTSELGRQARNYESEAQAAQAAQAAQEAQAAQAARAAQRAEAAKRARVLAAQRRAAAQRAAAERAAEQPPAPKPSTPPTADAQPKTTTAPPAAPSGSPQQIASAMLASFGWSSSEFGCLNELWVRESGWNPSATNPYSGAYGIPQALPGAKMASAGADWQTNPATQIRWGLGYIKATYGSPCAAWSHETSYGWY